MTFATPPSAEEQELVAQILKHADSEQQGYLTPQAAVDLFDRSGLSRVQLRDIWKLSDADSNGSFTSDELLVAVRLIGWLQSRSVPFSESLAERPGPLATFEGLMTFQAPEVPIEPPNARRVQLQGIRRQSGETNGSQSIYLIPQQPSNEAGPSRTPTRTPEPDGTSPRFLAVLSNDIREFHRLYLEAGPVQGFVEGGAVRDVYMRYNLALQDLRDIWTLVDNNGLGRLGFHEFALGLYLIQAIRNCHLKVVPRSVPEAVRAEVRRVCDDVMHSLQHESSPIAVRSRSPSAQLLGRAPSLPPKRTPVKPTVASKPWMVTARDKAEYNRVFSELDVHVTGSLSKDSVVEYLSQFHLAEDEMDHVMHLASIRKEPHLSADEFAVALHLVNSRLKGKLLPAELSTALIPPSLRARTLEADTQRGPPPPPAKPNFNKDLPPPIPPRKSSLSRPYLGSSTYTHDQVTSPVADYSSPHETNALSRSTTSAVTSIPTPSSANLPSEVRFRRYSLQAANPGHARRASSFIPQIAPITPALTPSSIGLLAEDEDPLEELKSETKSLRRQIESLLDQVSSQTSLRNQNEALGSENTRLKTEVSELEASLSSVLSQMQNNDNALSQALSQEIEGLSQRVAELEQSETQLQQTTGALEAAKRENAMLETQARELRAVEKNLNETLDDARHTMQELEREKEELEVRLKSITKIMSSSVPDATNKMKELQVFLEDMSHENQVLRDRVRKTERSMEQLLLSSKDATRIEDLRRKNNDLKGQVQELQQLTAQLQSSQEDNHLQQLLAAMTRENEGMKIRIRELQRNGRTGEMQRTIDELKAENQQLKSQLQTAATRQDMVEGDVPPPAYDDNFMHNSV